MASQGSTQTLNSVRPCVSPRLIHFLLPFSLIFSFYFNFNLFPLQCFSSSPDVIIGLCSPRPSSPPIYLIAFELRFTLGRLPPSLPSTSRTRRDSLAPQVPFLPILFVPFFRLLISTSAQRQMVINSKNTFYATKRLIGRRFTDAEVKKLSDVVRLLLVPYGRTFLYYDFRILRSASR